MNQAIATRGALFWLFQRLSGLFLAVFLFTHVKVLHWDFNLADVAMAPTGFLDFSFVAQRLAGSTGWVCLLLSRLHHLGALSRPQWSLGHCPRFPAYRAASRQPGWRLLWGAGVLASIWGFYTLQVVSLLRRRCPMNLFKVFKGTSEEVKLNRNVGTFRLGCCIG